MNFSAFSPRHLSRDTFFVSIAALLLCALSGCFWLARLGGYAGLTLRISGACALLAALQTLLHHWQRQAEDATNAQTNLPAVLEEQTLALAEADEDALLFLQPITDAAAGVQGFRITHGNRRAAELAATHGTLAGLDLGAVLPFLATPGTLQQYRTVLKTGEAQAVEVAVEEPGMESRWLRIAASRFGQALLLRLEDRTLARQDARDLCRQVQHDALTGLPNRMLLDDRIQQSLKRARRNNGASAVLLLDIDQFGKVNETYGRDAGDHVLLTVAQRLTEAVRITDSVVRLGGDKFVIVFDDVSTRGPVADFARKIVLSIFAPVVWQGQQLHITGSIGVAMYPNAGTTPETLLIQADIEMNRRKRAHFPALPAPPQPVTAEYSAFTLSLT